MRGGGWVPRAQARHHDVRGSRHRVRGRGVLAALPAQGEGKAWGTGSRPRSVRQPRRVRRAARQALRRPRHRRVQQRQRRSRAIARGRRGDRLHGAGLHGWRTAPRRDRGRARQGRIPAQPARAQARWTLSARRLSGGPRGDCACVIDRRAGTPPRPGALHHRRRRPEAGRPRVPAGADRCRQAAHRDWAPLHARRDCRSAPLRR